MPPEPTASYSRQVSSMISSAGSVLLRLGAWNYLPDFVTRKLLTYYHQFLVSHGRIPPQHGSRRWQTHYRIAYSISVLAYLSYNLFEAARSTPPNFYQVLGISPDADEASLRSAYRAFAKRYHPDRAGHASEPMFMAVQNAYESLKNPLKRFAYERFGPDALSWRHCSAPMDCLKHGIMQSSGFYIVSVAVLVVMSIVMKPSRVAFWRYILLLSLFASELYLVAGPRSFGILGILFPDRVAFQHVLFLHQLFVFLSIALSHVVPVLFPERQMIRPEDPATYVPWIQRLAALESMSDAEVLRMLNLELHAMSNSSTSQDTSSPADVMFDSVPPCEPPPEVLNELSKEMEDILVEQFVHSEPPLRALWDEAVRKSRESRAERQSQEGDSGSPREIEVNALPNSDVEGTTGIDSTLTQLHHAEDGCTARENPCLPSPSPSVSPEIRPIKLHPLKQANGDARSRIDLSQDQKEQQDDDDGSATPTGSALLSPKIADIQPRVNGTEDDSLVLRTTSSNSGGGKAFIRVVERRSVSPD
ncbi:DnaJ-domain-containing protein [Fomitiporia mediterranea MF3/22]|uniref:DnaJ-domain-containing protein n=1 Tax=Fomitiporia mediterranea (strain MF3/22) TaxID=694068 RepID=UPI00044084F9|nr:DnaJ-domain-containing protein [Fomitiporia mediterranea MF3/22]EJD08099.1 DnaJ-domain-containing protein [Fomitiporia mediterranea MF3/22]